jgi:hypothetical protein
MNNKKLIQSCVLASSIVMMAHWMPDDRRTYFLEWLHVHDTRLTFKKGDALIRVCDALQKWFALLPERDALREYGRIASEIAWWRDLTDETLMGMLET